MTDDVDVYATWSSLLSISVNSAQAQGVRAKLSDRVGVVQPSLDTIRFEGVADGQWTASIQSFNAAGASAWVTGNVTMDKAAVGLQDPVDWNEAITPTQVAAWEAATAPLAAMDEAAFWTLVIDDIENVPPVAPLTVATVAGFVEQLLLARLTTHWIMKPTNNPTMAQLGALADTVRANANATKGANPLPAPHADVWHQANALTDDMGADLPLRWKLLVVTRVLEELLGSRLSIPSG